MIKNTPYDLDVVPFKELEMQGNVILYDYQEKALKTLKMQRVVSWKHRVVLVKHK